MIRLSRGGTQVAILAAMLCLSAATASASEKTAAAPAVDSSPAVTMVTCEPSNPSTISEAVAADSVVYFLIIVPVHYIETDSHSPPTKVDSVPTFLHSVATRRDLTKKVNSDSAAFLDVKTLSSKKLSYSSAKSNFSRTNLRS